MILEGLKERGYQVVPVSELMGKTRADVMPPITTNERWAAWVDSLNFSLFGLVQSFIIFVFFVGDVLMSGRLVLVGVLAIYDRFAGARTVCDPNYRPAVAVLVPAYNEEKVIERTVRSVLDSDYPKLRVIVIDDGSQDATLEVTRTAFEKEIAAGRVTVLTKPNSGKADALDFGLEQVTEEVFVGIDADTLIAPDAISKLVPHFSNPKVAAMAGNAKVGNRVNLWTRWQALEYITSQNFERRALNTLNAVSVVPGAIGAWRTSAVRAAGGYQRDTVAEDADLTMALLQDGYWVNYEDRALAYTEAPTTANGLMRQRFRWSFGIMQAVWKHRGAVKQKGALGWVAIPNMVIFQILLPLVSPFIDIMFAVGAVTYFVDKYRHPESANPADFHKLVVYFALFMVIDFIASTHRLHSGAAAARRQARLPAAGPRLAAALRLSPIVLAGADQDAEARHGRPRLCLGQAGAHGQRAAAGGDSARKEGAMSPLPHRANGGRAGPARSQARARYERQRRRHCLQESRARRQRQLRLRRGIRRRRHPQPAGRLRHQGPLARTDGGQSSAAPV